MAREFFKNLPDTTTPLNAQRMNAFLNGEEAMGSIVVDDIECKNRFDELWLPLGKRYSNNSTYAFATTTAENNVGILNPIKLNRTKKYFYLYTNSSYLTNGIYFYNENGVWTGDRTFTNPNAVITIPETAYYMTFNIQGVTDIKDLKSYEWMIEYVESPTSTHTGYAPYKKFGYNSQESMGKIIVDDISCKNWFNDCEYKVMGLSNATLTKLANGYRVTSTSATTGMVYASLRSIPLAGLEGKTITFSFKTAINGLSQWSMELFTGSDQSRGTTLSWAVPNSYTFTVPDTLTASNSFLWMTLIGNRNASVEENSYIDFIDFQIELGNKATYFTPNKEISDKRTIISETIRKVNGQGTLVNGSDCATISDLISLVLKSEDKVRCSVGNDSSSAVKNVLSNPNIGNYVYGITEIIYSAGTSAMIRVIAHSLYNTTIKIGYLLRDNVSDKWTGWQ